LSEPLDIWAVDQFSRNSSHVVVLVNAHLGDKEQTSLRFVVPIPNAFPLIKETGGFDLTQAHTVSTGNCNEGAGDACIYSAEIGVYRNPLEQRVTGEISLLPPEVDILGRPADDALKAAQREDARISEVLLFAWPRSTEHQTFEVVKATKSDL